MLYCEYTVEWFVDGESVTGVIRHDTSFPFIPLKYTFNTPGKHVITLEVCNCCGCCKEEKVITVGPPVFIERQSCGIFKLQDWNTFLKDTVILELNIYNLSNELLSGKTVTDYLGDTFFTIELPQDGMYVIEYIIRSSDNEFSILDKQRFVVYEFCNILQCYKQILMSINCTDCKPCLDNIQEFTAWLNQLNMFVANLYALGYNIAVYSGLNNGVFLFREEYLTFLKETDIIINNLNRICGRCGFVSRMGDTPYKCKPKIKSCCG